MGSPTPPPGGVRSTTWVMFELRPDMIRYLGSGNPPRPAGLSVQKIHWDSQGGILKFYFRRFFGPRGPLGAPGGPRGPPRMGPEARAPPGGPPPSPPSPLLPSISPLPPSGPGHFPRAPLLHWGEERTWEKGDGMAFFGGGDDDIISRHGGSRSNAVTVASWRPRQRLPIHLNA